MLNRLQTYRLPMEAAFVSCYGPIRAVCSAPNAPGLAIFAIDRDGIHRAVLLPARPEGLHTAIVGCHPEIDVSLDDGTLSSRHLAIITHPTSDDRLWFRLIDLRSESGMYDERGERVEHCVSDGPICIHVGRFCLFVIPLCDPRLGWPLDPRKAWQEMPSRAFHRMDGAVRRSTTTPLSPCGRRSHWPTVDPKATLVQDIPGPRFARSVHRVLSIDRNEEEGEGSPPIGELLLANSSGASGSLLVDAAAARSGLLLGRDERCDERDLLDDQRISRVHLLILEVEGVVYAIDTASANGVWRKGADAGGVPLVFGQRLTIARGLAWIKWTPPPVRA